LLSAVLKFSNLFECPDLERTKINNLPGINIKFHTELFFNNLFIITESKLYLSLFLRLTKKQHSIHRTYKNVVIFVFCAILPKLIKKRVASEEHDS